MANVLNFKEGQNWDRAEACDPTGTAADDAECTDDSLDNGEPLVMLIVHHHF